MDGHTFRTILVIGAIALGGAYAENRRQAARRREESVDENIKRLAGIICQVGTEADRRLDHMGRHVAELLELQRAEDEACEVLRTEAMTDEHLNGLAEVAYNAYGDERGWKVASGADMPRWHQQDVGFRQGWMAAVRGVLRELFRPVGV